MDNVLNLTQTQSAILTMAVVLGMFLMFLREVYPTEVVAMIAAMFIIVGALVRTGALNAMTQIAERQAKVSPARAIGGGLVFVAFASAIMINTPLVGVMIPVFVQLART